MELYHHSVCPVEYLKYVFPFYDVKYDNKIEEIPVAIVTPVYVRITRGLGSNNARLSMMTSRQLGSRVCVERDSQTTHGSIVVERITAQTMSKWTSYTYHASPLGTGGIMFSRCPSVRLKPEIPSFYQYMGPLFLLTIRDRFVACPSVRLQVNA